MTTPNPMAEQLRRFLPSDFVPSRAAGARVYSADDGLQFAQRIAHALDQSERLPVSATVTHNDDGSLTIHVTPDESVTTTLQAF